MCSFIGRQTSDPKSGFATVEKDLPGGLTPMLGDRKVICIGFEKKGCFTMSFIFKSYFNYGEKY